MTKGKHLTGKVQWYDKNKGHGIVVDKDGNEYYIDSSVCYYSPSRNDYVSIDTSRVDNVLCGRNVYFIMDDVKNLY